MGSIKKYIGIAIAAMALMSCDSKTYDEIGEEIMVEGDVTYNGHVKAIIDANCVTCHNPQGLAAHRPLTNYMEVKDAVEMTNLLERIQMMNGEPELMPQTGRMPQEQIDVILEWEMDGLLEN